RERSVLSGALCRAWAAADKTVRAPGMAAVTERGCQPAATPENAEAPHKATTPPRSGAVGSFWSLVSCVGCCGQDCPRSGNGSSDGARVSTRSNARKRRGAPQGHYATAVGSGRFWLEPCVVRGLLRTRLSALREWKQ